MSLTEIITKQTPHLTPTLLLGACAVLLPALTVLDSAMDNLATKPNVQWYDFVKVVGLVGIGAISGLQSFMNQTYGRFMAAKEERRKLTETEFLQQQVKV